MSLLLTIAGLAIGFVILCKLLMVGVRAVARPVENESAPNSQPDLKPTPVRR